VSGLLAFVADAASAVLVQQPHRVIGIAADPSDNCPAGLVADRGSGSRATEVADATPIVPTATASITRIACGASST